MRVHDSHRQTVEHERPSFVGPYGVENRIAPGSVERLIPSRYDDGNQGHALPAGLEARVASAVFASNNRESEDFEQWYCDAVRNCTNARRRAKHLFPSHR